MCGAVWQVMNWHWAQTLPDGYEVGCEVGELSNGRIGIGCYYWHHVPTGDIGDPQKSRWDARRDCIAHAQKQPK